MIAGWMLDHALASSMESAVVKIDRVCMVSSPSQPLSSYPKREKRLFANEGHSTLTTKNRHVSWPIEPLNSLQLQAIATRAEKPLRLGAL
jgi:hypothetical protein